MFDDARSRFGDARRGAPTASRHAQWSSAIKPRFWGSTLKFTVKSLKWYTYISTKCHENMCISFYENMTWILRKDKSFYDNLVGSWVKAALGSTVVSTWLGPPRFGLKAAKDAKLGLSLMATTPFFTVSIKGEVDQKMQKNTGKWSRRSLRIKSRR